MNRNWAIIGLTCLSFSLIEKWRRSRCVWGKTHQINPRFPFSFVSASKHEEASNSDLFHFFQYSFPFTLSFSLLLLLLATSFLISTTTKSGGSFLNHKVLNFFPDFAVRVENVFYCCFWILVRGFWVLWVMGVYLVDNFISVVYKSKMTYYWYANDCWIIWCFNIVYWFVIL